MRRVRLVGLVMLAGAAISAAALSAPRQHPPPAAAPAPGGHGTAEMQIAAVVNDEVITNYDLAERMRMVMTSSNLSDTPEVRQRIAGQVLRTLIDEKLQLQEAKKENVTATEDEIKAALGQIEKQNNMQPGQLDVALKARGIDREAVVHQVTASLVWAKLVRRMAAQNTEISDQEVDDALKRLKEHANEPQSHVAEIFLAVDNPSQEEEVRKLAEKLSEQMKHGARFSAVAQQFSQSATAAVGGDLGWIRSDQLAPELAKQVSQLKPGELSPPIRSGGGFYLLLVLERRNVPGSSDTVFDVVQVVLPVPANANDAARRQAIAEADKMRGEFKDCPTMLKIGKSKAPEFSSEGKLLASQIAPQLRSLIEKLTVGQPSPPIVQRNGVGIVMLCGKSAEKTGEITRQEAMDSLIKQRLDTLSRRYMRDLRRSAYVDVRV